MCFRTVLGALALLIALPGQAAAADPIMPLSQVERGMKCTGLSVIRGTDITSFDVEVLDVVQNQPADESPRILIRVSGEAVEDTGIGPGFSGSPIYCRDRGGVARNIGAISEGVGEYGNRVALATPIESVLGEPVDPPRASRSAPTATSRRSLAAPLTVSGLSPSLVRTLAQGARRAGGRLLAAPAAPLSRFPPQTLRPGSAVSVGLSSGDLALGAIGTVAYVDGDRVWAFGHSFENSGARALLLQDAYVYGVTNNPFGLEGAISTKLAAPGHNLGTLTSDYPSAVAGRLGALPSQVPVRIAATDLDTGRRRITGVDVADETALGNPDGFSALNLVGPLAVAQAAVVAMRDTPARQSGTMCVRIMVRERPKPMRFCNRYVADRGGDAEGDFAIPTSVASILAEDLSNAIGTIDSFNFGPLTVTGVEAEVKMRRGLQQVFILGAKLPPRVRAGGKAIVTMTVGRGTTRQDVRFPVRVPRKLKPGSRTLTLTGSPADRRADGAFLLNIGALLEEGEGEVPLEAFGGDSGPKTIDELVARVQGLHRYDGVRATFEPPQRDGQPNLGRGVYRDRAVRISGVASVPVTVVGPRRPARRR